MMTFAYYAVVTAYSPVKAMNRLLTEPQPIRPAAQAVGFVGALYALTSAALAMVGAVPLAPVFIQVRPENYYFWQMIFVIPYALLAWVLAAGLIRLVGRREQGGPAFEETASLAGIALAASLFIAWIPMALTTLFMVVGMSQEELVDVLSRPGGWQVFYVLLHLAAAAAAVVLLTLAAGEGHVPRTGCVRVWLAGILAAVVLSGTFMLFIR